MLVCELGLVALVRSCGQIGFERIHVGRQFGDLSKEDGQVDAKNE